MNNCDLSEHDTLDDLQILERKTVQELKFLIPSPEMYSFSALMRLFEAMEKKIKPPQSKNAWLCGRKMLP